MYIYIYILIYARYFDVNLVHLNLFLATDCFLYQTVNIRKLMVSDMFSGDIVRDQWHEMD